MTQSKTIKEKICSSEKYFHCDKDEKAFSRKTVGDNNL